MDFEIIIVVLGLAVFGWFIWDLIKASRSDGRD